MLGLAFLQLALCALASAATLLEAGVAWADSAQATTSPHWQVNHGVLLHGRVDLPDKADLGCGLTLKASTLRLVKGQQVLPGLTTRLQATVVGSNVSEPNDTGCSAATVCIAWDASTASEQQYTLLVPMPEAATEDNSTAPQPSTLMLHIQAAWSCPGAPTALYDSWTRPTTDHVLQHDIHISNLTDAITCPAVNPQPTDQSNTATGTVGQHASTAAAVMTEQSIIVKHNTTLEQQAAGDEPQPVAAPSIELDDAVPVAAAAVQSPSLLDNASMVTTHEQPPDEHQHPPQQQGTASKPFMHQAATCHMRCSTALNITTWSEWAADAASHHVCIPPGLLAGLPEVVKLLVSWTMSGPALVPGGVCVAWSDLLWQTILAAVLFVFMYMMYCLYCLRSSAAPHSKARAARGSQRTAQQLPNRHQPNAATNHKLITKADQQLDVGELSQPARSLFNKQPQAGSEQGARAWQDYWEQDGASNPAFARTNFGSMPTHEEDAAAAPPRVATVRNSIQAAIRASGHASMSLIGALLPGGAGGAGTRVEADAGDGGRRDASGDHDDDDAQQVHDMSAGWTRDAHGRLRRFRASGQEMEEWGGGTPAH